MHSNTFNSTTDKEYFDENEENDYDDEDEDDDEIYDDDEDALIDKVERLNVEHLNRDIKKQPLDQLDKLLFINDSRSDFVRNTRYRQWTYCTFILETSLHLFKLFLHLKHIDRH